MSANPSLPEEQLSRIKLHLTELIESVIDNAFLETGKLYEKLQLKESALEMASDSGSPLLNVNEAAKYLRISRSMLCAIKSEGRIKEIKIGSRVYFRVTSLDEFLDKRELECNR